MNKTVDFVVGRAGSGKSRMLRHRVQELLGVGGQVVFIVPEQFTFETERALAESLGAGLMDVAVYSFTSLSRKVLRETGERRTFLSREGRRMVIRKAVEENEDELAAFKNVCKRAGFAEACDDVFTLSKRFAIAPEDMRVAANRLAENTPLRAKLNDLSMLYIQSEAYYAQRSIDSEDAFAALEERLPHSSLSGKHVIIDGFDLISERLYGVIDVILVCSASLTVSIRGDLDPSCRDKRIFEGEMRVYERVGKLARDKGFLVRDISLPKKNAPWGEGRHMADDLAFLEREAFTYSGKTYAGDANSIILFAATDVFAEAQAAADAVVSAVNDGLRYRDIAIIASDMDAYMNPVIRALRGREIPFFTDAKHQLNLYAAPRLVMAALKAVSKAYPQNEVLKLVKSGLSGVERSDAEHFENYVVRYGMRGNALITPFARGEVPLEAERARAVLMPPLMELRAGLASSADAGGKIEALSRYLDAIDLRSQLVEITNALRDKHQLELMEENAQVYNLLCEMLTQLHAIMGDVKMPSSRFVAVIEEGLAAYDVGAIPTTADQLLFGSIGRTRARDAEMLLILGANEGKFPAYVGDDSLIDDHELSALASAGLTPWTSSRERNAKGMSDVYGVISKPKQRLYMSYTIGGDGSTACSLIERIKTMFPLIRESTNVGANEIQSAAGGYDELVRRLRAAVDAGRMDDDTALLYAAYAGQASYASRLDDVEDALYHQISPEPFGRELAHTLYLPPGSSASFGGSATRLETFNACPFKHYARYGLRIEPRKEYRERRADEGAFCHEALELFTRELVEDKINLTTMIPEQINSLLDRILPELIATHNNGILMETARMRARCARLIRRVRATAHAMVRQMALGGFRSEGSEIAFGKNGTLPPIEMELNDGTRYQISGKIDRLDSYTDENGTRYLRVVDYKTGNTDFRYEELYHGLKLQLPLYINAVLAADRAAKAAGMYYLPVKEPSVPEKKDMGNKEALERELYKELRLSGITLADANIIEVSAGDDAIKRQTANAGLAQAGQMQEIMDYALHKSALTAQNALEGNAAATPYRKSKQENACARCDYSALCQFDTSLAGCAYRHISSMKADEFFKRIHGGASDEMDK